MSHRPRRGLATWLTTSAAPLFVLDERRVVLVFNRGCEQLTGWQAADVIGRPCEYSAPSDPARVESITAALCPPATLDSAASAVSRAVIPRRDGALIERDVHFFLMTEESDRGKAHILGILTPPRSDFIPAPLVRHIDLTRHQATLHQRFSVDRLVARSPAMERVAAQIELARQQRVSVHLSGEPGVGKEHVARLIHYGSPDRQQRFVPLRCATASHFELSRTLNRLAEQQDGDSPIGAVYLDCVNSLPRDLQTQVVALMVRRTAGIRWFSSSAAALERLGEEMFDPTLAMRLTLLPMHVPPLRERGEDLLLLAQQLLEEADRDGERRHDGFSATVERMFQGYSWPGNVDELSRVVSRASQRASGRIVEVEDLPFEFTAGRDARDVRPDPATATLDDRLARFERQLIAEALASVRGNKSAAADLLGLPRAKLYRRLEALGLEAGENVQT